LCPNTPELRDDQNDIKDVGKTVKMAFRFWGTIQVVLRMWGKRSIGH
jgi:hypothetical protein